VHDEQEQRARLQLERLLRRVDTWVGLTSRPVDIEACSALAGDDKATDPYHVSHAAWLAVGYAVDHVRAVRDLLFGAKVMATWALYSLIRGAIENAARAVWLLEPRQRDMRVLRRLRLAWNNQQMALRAAQVARDALDDASDDDTMEEKAEPVRARLASLAEARGIDPTAVLGGQAKVSYSEIVRTVDEVMAAGPAVALAWQVCSANAHGDTWAALQFVDLTEVGRLGNVGQFHVTASTGHLVPMVDVAAALIDFALFLFGQRSTAPS
jgi:hypothetical protein